MEAIRVEDFTPENVAGKTHEELEELSRYLWNMTAILNEKRKVIADALEKRQLEVSVREKLAALTPQEQAVAHQILYGSHIVEGGSVHPAE